MSSPCWRSTSRNWRKSWYGIEVLGGHMTGITRRIFAFGSEKKELRAPGRASSGALSRNGRNGRSLAPMTDLDEKARLSGFRFIGKPVVRKEDARLTTGKGRFSDDFGLDGQAHAVMVRSP